MSGIPYLGSKISLISKSEIRYEGILVDVNPQESTITFEQVRFFGTEGRRPGDEIAPMDRVFDCVVFRSADIKDLQVYETPVAAAPVKEKEPEFPDPAVVSFASSSAQNAGGFQYQSKSEVKMPKVNDYASAAATQQQQAQPQNSNTTKSFTTRNNNNNRSSSGSNYHQKPRGVVVPQSEFDFSQSNAKFSKEELAAMNVVETESVPVVPSYNKNLSFFDEISCQTNTESGRGRNHNERNLNMETFGQAAPPRRYGHRGGRGRGGYRGNYNRGGYNNSNSNYNNTSNNNNNNNSNN